MADPSPILVFDQAALVALIDARIVAAARPPVLISQRTVTEACSLPKEDYLEAARAGAFPSFKVRRLVMAKTADVVAWIETKRRPTPDPDPELAALDEALASVGGRRVATKPRGGR